jgi:hypothetical protein
MRVGDYFQHRKRLWLRLHEKGGKRHEVPCRPSLEVHMNDWIKVTGIAAEKKKPLFRSVHKGDNLTGNAMSRFDIFQMIKAACEGRWAPLLHLLRHIPSHWYRDVFAERGNVRARPDHRESRIAANHQALRPHSRRTIARRNGKAQNLELEQLLILAMKECRWHTGIEGSEIIPRLNC